jgi:hypothetical protein
MHTKISQVIMCCEQRSINDSDLHSSVTAEVGRVCYTTVDLHLQYATVLGLRFKWYTVYNVRSLLKNLIIQIYAVSILSQCDNS